MSKYLDDDVAPAPPRETLRGRCAHAHRPCGDRGCGNFTTGAPVPPVVPGEFTVWLREGWGGFIHELAEEMESYELGSKVAMAMWTSSLRAKAAVVIYDGYTHPLCSILQPSLVFPSSSETVQPASQSKLISLLTGMGPISLPPPM